ncbi:MAG: LamG-like jellyroll fold domain-containing protein [Pirellulaceae bacterium]
MSVALLCAVSILSPPVTDAQQAKPILALAFEANVIDPSALNHSCLPHGEIPWVEGRRGMGALFTGHSWIDTGITQQELGDEFTIECWVNHDKQQGQYADIFGNHVAEGRGFVVQQDGGRMNHFYAAYGAGNGKWVMTDPVPLAAGRWQHVAMVKSRLELQLFLNGVPVAVAPASTAPALSAMNVAVGVGYTDPERCFRGLIDDFRIWNVALANFEHAGIDASAARETLAQCLDTTPRPVANAVTQSWTLATDDTRLTLGVTADGELVVSELCNPRSGWNWITRPVLFGLLPRVDVAGESRSLRWRFVEATKDQTDGLELTLRFVCEDPAMDLVSKWQAGEGPGPIRHCLSITNRSAETLTILEQPTFDLDITGAAAMWCFHSDGGTPDAVGVYRRPLGGEPAGRRYLVSTAPTGEFIPYAVFESHDRHGVYIGLEWSFCRIETVTLSGTTPPVVRVRGGNVADLHMELGPGTSVAVRPGFVGAYSGDLDDAGNGLRRWLMQYCMPAILREDPGYPKIQWNAFGAAGKTPGSWDPVEQKYYPWIDDIVPLGFEEVMIDVAWWEGDEPVADPADWSSGMKKAADYAHARGLRFGLYWTDNLDMSNAEARRQRAARVDRLFREYKADLWRSDSTRGEVVESSFAATQGFYDLLDTLEREVPGFEWENCSGGGRIKDFGAMRRAVKIFNSDTYSPLHVRQAFYDSSYAFHPVQLEGHVGSTDGRYRPAGVAGLKYAFRSMSMGAPEWFLDAPNGGNGSDPWTADEKEAVRGCVETYKSRIRPLVRQADLYHVLSRPDGRHWDGLEYYDPATGKGVVFLFKPSNEIATQRVQLRGLDETRSYRLDFEDGTHASCIRSAAELMGQGMQLSLPGDESSELMFFEIVR